MKENFDNTLNLDKFDNLIHFSIETGKEIKLEKKLDLKDIDILIKDIPIFSQEEK